MENVESVSVGGDYLPPDARRFMDLLPSNQRARCGNLFHMTAREGVASVEALTDATCKAARARLRYSAIDTVTSPDRADGYYRLLLAIHHDAPGAKAYADFVLRWQRLPLEYRKAVKRARAQSAMMAQQSEKEVAA